MGESCCNRPDALIDPPAAHLRFAGFSTPLRTNLRCDFGQIRYGRDHCRFNRILEAAPLNTPGPMGAFEYKRSVWQDDTPRACRQSVTKREGSFPISTAFAGKHPDHWRPPVLTVGVFSRNCVALSGSAQKGTGYPGRLMTRHQNAGPRMAATGCSAGRPIQSAVYSAFFAHLLTHGKPVMASRSPWDG